MSIKKYKLLLLFYSDYCYTTYKQTRRGDSMNIGPVIKQKRKEAGLSQKALGELLNVSQAMIAQYENGTRKPKLETLRKIFSVLNADIQEVFKNHPFEYYQELNIELNHDNEQREHLLTYYYRYLDRTGRDSLMEILSNLQALNDIGQKEASKRVEELTEISKYKRNR